jgi:hypothetical protein
VPDNFDFGGGGLGHLLGWVATRAGGHPRWWVAAWLAAILAVTTTAVVCHAPPIAYVMLLVVAVVAFLTDGPSDKSQR